MAPTAWPLFKRSSVAAFERSVTLQLDAYHSDLESGGIKRLIVEGEWALRQMVYELLKRVIGQVFRDADDVASATTNFFNADQDVRVGASKGIRKTEKIFEDFRFLIVSRLRKTGTGHA
jgi:hypothetical protein